MITADYVAIAAGIVFLLSGASMGFGKQLKNLTGGIIGVIISVVVCYFLYGIVLNIEFVQSLLLDFRSILSEKGTWLTNLLLKIHVESVVYAIALFLVVQIARLIIVSVIKNVFEIDNVVMKTVNKVLGAILFVAVTFAIILVVFQISSMISGTESEIYKFLEGSKLKLDVLYTDNPLDSLSDFYAKAKETVTDIVTK